MKVLLTGANGFLGSHIADALLAAGIESRLLVRETSRLGFIEGLSHERAYGDVRHPATLEAALAGIDTVIHSAGLTSARREEEFQAVNQWGTEGLVDAARRAGVRRFVYVSSLAAQGPSPDGRFQDPEKAEPHPMTAYGRSKLAGERAVLAAGSEMSVAIVRPPIIYGPRDRALLPFYRLVRMRLMPIYGDGSRRISWIAVSDAAAAIMQVAFSESGAGAIFTISDGCSYSWCELTDLVAEALGRRPLRVHIPAPVFGFAGSTAELLNHILPRPLPLNRQSVREMAERYWICGNEQISARVGWQPVVTAAEGVRATAEWYRARGWL